MSSVKLFLGVLTGGVAVGVILGVLFAPDKGSNTRKRISNKSQESSNELEDQYKSLIQNLKKVNGKLKAEQMKAEFTEALKL